MILFHPESEAQVKMLREAQALPALFWALFDRLMAEIENAVEAFKKAQEEWQKITTK